MNCLLAQGSTFLDSCDFERENICGMIQGREDMADWVRVSEAAGGPDTDYSNMGKCTGDTNLRGLWHKIQTRLQVEEKETKPFMNVIFPCAQSKITGFLLVSLVDVLTETEGEHVKQKYFTKLNPYLCTTINLLKDSLYHILL